MHATQVALGLALLGVSAATVVGASTLDSQFAGFVPIVAAVIGAVALAIGVDTGRRRRTW